MENLLCDESWLSGYRTPESSGSFRRTSCDDNTMEEAISVDLEKELLYMPRIEYVQLLVSKDLTEARFRAVRWLIKSQGRLNLSFGTIFSAANCLDRFISTSGCDEWKYWMVELLSVACLSTASKFKEVAYPSLHEIQMEGLDHTFQPSTIQQMELILLKALGWRVSAITSHSFSEMIALKIGFSKHFPDEEIIRSRVTDHLLEDLSDLKMLEYTPSVVAVSAVWNVLEEMVPFPSAIGDHLEWVTKLLDEERKENVAKCVVMMRSRQVEKMVDPGPESPVTVLFRDRRQTVVGVKGDSCRVDLSMFRNLRSDDEPKKKRDRESYEEKWV